MFQRLHLKPSENAFPIGTHTSPALGVLSTLIAGSGVTGLGFYSMTRAPTRWKLVRQPSRAQPQQRNEESRVGRHRLHHSGAMKHVTPCLSPFDPP